MNPRSFRPGVRSRSFQFDAHSLYYRTNSYSKVGSARGVIKVDGVSMGESSISLTEEETRVLKDIMQMASRRKRMLLKKKYEDESKKQATPESSQADQ